MLWYHDKLYRNVKVGEEHEEQNKRRAEEGIGEDENDLLLNWVNWITWKQKCLYTTNNHVYNNLTNRLSS
jgi:uncharacterized membrane-anchored protein